MLKIQHISEFDYKYLSAIMSSNNEHLSQLTWKGKIMTQCEANKQEFLKYAGKQKEGVRQYTSYWISGAMIAAVILLILIFR